MNFGERLKKILDELDVSQNELSRRTDKESSYISKIINGKVNVSWSTIQEFADALNISPGQFFANESEMVRLMMQELPPELVEWLRQREESIFAQRRVVEEYAQKPARIPLEKTLR